MKTFFKSLVRDERGISALEYAILAGIVIVAVVAGVATFGDKIGSLFGNSNEAIDRAVTESGGSGN